VKLFSPYVIEMPQHRKVFLKKLCISTLGCLLLQYSVPAAYLTLTLLTWTKWWAPASASKWRMEFNSAFKGLSHKAYRLVVL
jgi:hypothetical protein